MEKKTFWEVLIGGTPSSNVCEENVFGEVETLSSPSPLLTILLSRDR
jgi:hypothetical protein